MFWDGIGSCFWKPDEVGRGLVKEYCAGILKFSMATRRLPLTFGEFDTMFSLAYYP